MSEKFIAQWEKIRAKGKNNFVWVRGVLIWGLVTAVMWSIFMEYTQPSANKLIRPVIALILFPCGGFFWGLLTWHFSEKKYNKLKENKLNSKQ